MCSSDLATNSVLMKQWVEPESTSARKVIVGEITDEVRGKRKEFGLDIAAALSLTSGVSMGIGRLRDAGAKMCSHSFSLPLTVAVLAFVLDADEDDLGHSLARCPELPQKRQRLLSKCRLHSSAVSLPSFPNLSDS